VLLLLGATTTAQEDKTEKKSVRVGTFLQQKAQKFTTKEGLPSDEILSLTVLGSGEPVAGTSSGLARFADGRWSVLPDSEGIAVPVVTSYGNTIVAVAQGTVYKVDGDQIDELGSIPSEAGTPLALATDGNSIILGTTNGAYTLEQSGFGPVAGLNERLGNEREVRAVALGPEGRIAVAAQSGLFERGPDGALNALTPREKDRSWAPYDVHGVAYDSKGQLWFASPQGVGVRGAEGWKLYTGREGLPFNSFTSMAASPDGSVWFGTTMGAIHFDGQTWEYREGKLWLPGNEVRGVAVGTQGAWFATDKGVGLIETLPMTLAEKAQHYEHAIDKYNRRTPYGYVLEASLPAPGDTSTWTNHDSDNDGLWTSMYGAGECFAYGATKDAFFRERARKAFEALRFLMDVTQGGTPPAQPGFIARTILPTSGPNPNESDYTPEKDRKEQKIDKMWKVLVPRWGTSADGKWYWKADTSSDELDGHYFFYAAYYDLVADSDAEKDEVRRVVVALTDHLLRNNYQLVDHDGKPTRWAIYNPEVFNDNPWWFMERGLNSLSILSYLSVAHHMTGDAKYQDAMNELMDKHGYHMNLMYPKWHTGPGSGNHSDDEMAYMSFYNLMKYIPRESKLWQCAGFSWWSYWQMEKPELNPLFNFMYAGLMSNDGFFSSGFADIPLVPKGHWLEQSVDTLKRFPLDRVNWRHTNNHRIDIERLPNHLRQPEEMESERPARTGRRFNGLVLPVDERFFNHWNHDPYSLNEGGNGEELGSGTVFLLPYYIGLYHGFITE
jgi:hypothetical protein